MRGDRLRKLRESLNISQADLALELGMSEIQILRYEKGAAVPRADAVVKIANFFNVTTDYLLGLSEETANYVRNELKPREQVAIDAWRHGDRMKAIRVIAGDE